MGAGKTTVGRRVAELAGAEFVDVDALIEQRAGRSVSEIFAAGGEGEFRRLEREAFRSALAGDRVLALGGGAPMQEEIWTRVRAEALSVCLDVPLSTVRTRLGTGAGRPLAGGDLESLLEQRVPRYRAADHVIDGERPVEEIAREVAALWSA